MSLGLVNLVDGADVRMIQCRGGLGFALKTAECLRVFGYLVGQELEGDVATEFEVFRLIHDAHTPTADPAEDPVMGDCLTHGLGRSSHWREC